MKLSMTTMLMCYREIRQRLAYRHIRHASCELYTHRGTCNIMTPCNICPVLVRVPSYNSEQSACMAKVMLIDNDGFYTASDHRHMVMKLLEPFAKELS